MNQTMGILGYGKIGEAIARRSAALGMRTIATKVHGPFSPPPPPLTWLSDDNDELLKRSPTDFDALYDALVNKSIGGAVLDVWPQGCWSFPEMECGPPYGSAAEPYRGPV